MPETPASETATTGDTSATAFSITQVFDAPRELVWQAWTEPARFAQ